MLLGAQDGPGSGNSDPPYKGLGGNLEMLHSITTDKSARPPKTGLAMNGKYTLVPLTQIDEFVQDALRGRRPVNEIQI